MVLIFTRLINGLATAVASTATGTIAACITPKHVKVKGLVYFH